MRNNVIIAIAAAAVGIYSSNVQATEFDGLNSSSLVIGPSVRSLTGHYSVINAHNFSGPLDVHIQERLPGGSIDTTECPSNYGSLGAPANATALSRPSLSTNGLLAIAATVGGVWKLYLNGHSSNSYGACSGWLGWTEMDGPDGTITSAPSIVTVGNRTFVFVMTTATGGSAPYLRYRVRSFNSVFHIWQWSDWYGYGYVTYPFLNASGLGAPVATIQNNQIVVTSPSVTFGVTWIRTMNLGTGLGDVTWYANDDCGIGGGTGYGWRYDSMSGVVSASAVGESNGSGLWFSVVLNGGQIRVHQPDWLASCSGQYPAWTTIANGWSPSTSIPALGSIGWGSNNFFLVQSNIQWFGGVGSVGMFESSFAPTTGTWSAANENFNVYP